MAFRDGLGPLDCDCGCACGYSYDFVLLQKYLNANGVRNVTKMNAMSSVGPSP